MDRYWGYALRVKRYAISPRSSHSIALTASLSQHRSHSIALTASLSQLQLSLNDSL